MNCTTMRLFVLLLVVLMTRESRCLGNVHTSYFDIVKLKKLDTRITHILAKYVKQEDQPQDYLNAFLEGSHLDVDDEAFAANPINCFVLLKRMAVDLRRVLSTLQRDSLLKQAKKDIDDLLTTVELPTVEDVKGAAWSIVRLQETYSLDIDKLTQGIIGSSRAAEGLTADDCFLFGEQSFNNLAFNLSQTWNGQGTRMLQLRGSLTSRDAEMIRKLETADAGKRMMRDFVTRLAHNSDKFISDQFSGLGIPTSFAKEVFRDEDDVKQLDFVEERYKLLCRGHDFRPLEARTTLNCGYIFGKKGYSILVPFKAELLLPNPLMILYHDVIREEEAKHLQQLALPTMKTTMIHSYTTHAIRKSISRVGKTSWVQRNSTPVASRIATRVEMMTGLTVNTGEDFHLLNYGVAGQYDIHVDFFDLAKKGMESAAEMGDRIATVLFYLNDVDAGGATVFPTLGLSIPARMGTALMWFNLLRNGQGDYRTVHASCPVLLGSKWIANLWLHERGQEFRWPCSLDPDV